MSMYSLRKQRKIDVPLKEVMTAIVRAQQGKVTSEQELLNYFIK